MVKSGELGTISHMLVRFNQPGIQRYLDEGNSWMVTNRRQAEARSSSLDSTASIFATTLQARFQGGVGGNESRDLEARHRGLRVRDTAHPERNHIYDEPSYTFPTTGSDSERKIAGEKLLVRAANGAMLCNYRPGRNGHQAPGGLRGKLARCSEGLSRPDRPRVRTSSATVRDCARAVSLTFDAYRVAGRSLLRKL